ncbi:MAG: hypothetical protein ABI454_04255 [Sphingomicrobium sp.]
MNRALAEVHQSNKRTFQNKGLLAEVKLREAREKGMDVGGFLDDLGSGA